MFCANIYNIKKNQTCFSLMQNCQAGLLEHKYVAETSKHWHCLQLDCSLSLKLHNYAFVCWLSILFTYIIEETPQREAMHDSSKGTKSMRARLWGVEGDPHYFFLLLYFTPTPLFEGRKLPIRNKIFSDFFMFVHIYIYILTKLSYICDACATYLYVNRKKYFNNDDWRPND